MGIHELDAFQSLGHGRPECPEELDVAGALVVQLVELVAVVDDRRLVAEHLGAEAMLGMEVRDGDQKPLPVRFLLRRSQDARAVDGAHRGVDDQHSVLADDDADVRHERHPAVRDHPHARRDLGDALGDDGRGRRG